METRKGWINIHYDIETGKVFCSNKPYETEDLARTGIFIGTTICRVACIEIEYPYITSNEQIKNTNNK